MEIVSSFQFPVSRLLTPISAVWKLETGNWKLFPEEVR
jgi:hypothetical protein